MAPLLERSHRAQTSSRRGGSDRASYDVVAPTEEVANAVRMKLKAVFQSTNAAVLEPPDGAERIVVFAPQWTRALRLALGGDIQAVTEGLRLVDWWPVPDDAARRVQPPDY
ncbi:MAG: hypothetical protein QOD76_865 [Solirubrobacteraceae bacterium]|nr:hypothetical protein [Solirubrobacteraceae bacterium]